MPHVHLRFSDSITKHARPVRLQIRGEAGELFVPLGRLPIFPCGRGEEVGGHVRIGSENWCYVDGGCEIPLPAGVPIRVRATCGPEFEIVDRTVILKPGQLALRFDLVCEVSDHWGTWLRGDSRAHELSPAAAALEGAAEGLDVVQILARPAQFLAQDGNTYPTLRNICDFSGHEPAHSAHGCEVYVNTLNSHPVLGSLGLLNSHRIIHPLVFGEPDGPDDWTLCDWADQCHRKKGLVTWVDAFRTGRPLMGGGALVACLLGKIDAIELDPEPRAQPLLPWIYRLWNAGFPVPLVGGSGKESNRMVLGSYRTYAKPNEDHPTWIEAARAGNTFVTNGPLIQMKIDGNRVSAEVESIVPFEKTEILFNGKILPGGELPDGVGGWIAARCIGGAESALYPGGPVFAHTSPVTIPGEAPADIRGRDSLLDCLEKLRGWIVHSGQFTQAKAKDQHIAELEAAKGKLLLTLQ